MLRSVFRSASALSFAAVISVLLVLTGAQVTVTVTSLKPVVRHRNVSGTFWLHWV